MTGELVPVPEAIAVASLGGGRPLAVYDFGADTFDVSVLDSEHRILADGSLSDVGGLDIDQALLEHIGRSVSHKDPAGWQRLEATTSILPFKAIAERRQQLRLGEIGWLPVAVAAGLYAVLLVLHPWVIGVSPLG